LGGGKQPDEVLAEVTHPGNMTTVFYMEAFVRAPGRKPLRPRTGIYPEEAEGLQTVLSGKNQGMLSVTTVGSISGDVLGH
jgi:hypothetical protein